MAQVPYSPVPDVQPTSAPHDDYFNINVTPDMFGAQIGRAEQNLGSTLGDVGQEAMSAAINRQHFYNETTKEDAYNQFQSGASKLLYGDPSNPSNPGFLSKQGADAMKVYSGDPDDPSTSLQGKIEALRQQVGSNLNPAAKLEFEVASRRFSQYAMEKAGSHYDQQIKTYGLQTANATVGLALNGIAQDYSSDEAFQHHWADAQAATVKQYGIQGYKPDDPVTVNALNDLRSKAELNRFEGYVTGNDPAGAIKYYEANKDGFKEQTRMTLLPRVHDLENGAWVDQKTIGPANGTPGGMPATGAQPSANWKEGIHTGTDSSGPVNLDPLQPQVKAGLENLRQNFGADIAINSATGGMHSSRASYHYQGLAVDLNTNGMDDATKEKLIESARQAGFTGFGLGESHLHIDMRPTPDGNPFVFGDDYKGPVAGKDIPAWQAQLGGTSKGGVSAQGNAGGGDASSLVRVFEGFRSNAYWDKTHWRTGYGSDTVTHADGTIEPVTAMTTVTKEDAERDLARRVGISQSQAQQAVGENWSKLSPQAQAAMTSVTYNYGHVPSEVAAAAKSGDSNAVAQAIASLPSNPGRRQKEASYITGGFTLGGVGSVSPGGAIPQGMTVPFQGQPAFMPSITTAAQGDNTTAPQGQPSAGPTDNGALAPAPSTSPRPLMSPNGMAMRPMDEVLQEAAQQFGNDPQRLRGVIAAVKERYAGQEMNAAAEERRIKMQSEQQLGTYMDRLKNGDTKNIIQDIEGDKKIDNARKPEYVRFFQEQVGRENTPLYGPGYAEAYHRILLPPSDPNRIADSLDILRRAAPGGDITESGAQKLLGVLNFAHKDVDGAGLAQVKNGAYTYAKDHMSFTTWDETGRAMPDQKGTDLFNTKFIPQFESAYDSWVQDGKNPHDFPLFQSDKLDALIDKIRPKKQLDQDRMQQGGNEIGQAPPVPPPQGVDPVGWSTVMRAAPSTGGKPWAPQRWADAVNFLRANPTPENIKAWDEKFGQNGTPAEQIIGRLSMAPTTPNREPPETPQHAPVATAPATFGMPPLGEGQ